jgi:hypothetical protein
MEVTVCKILTINPTTREAISIGAEAFRTRYTACLAISIIIVSFITITVPF